MIPIRSSSKWIGVYIIYAALIFIGFFVTRIKLGDELFSSNTFRLFIISLGSALIPCIGGFLGKRLFFIIYTISAIIGVLYMFYVIFGNTAPGWGDLTSLIGYLFLLCIGTIVGFIAEIVSFFINKKNNK